MQPINKSFAEKIYELLILDCGADRDRKKDFAHHFSKDNPGSQFRFSGLLGNSGVFIFDRFRVDCSHDDATQERLNLILKTNNKINEMIHKFAPEILGDYI